MRSAFAAKRILPTSNPTIAVSRHPPMSGSGSESAHPSLHDQMLCIDGGGIDPAVSPFLCLTTVVLSLPGLTPRRPDMHVAARYQLRRMADSTVDGLSTRCSPVHPGVGRLIGRAVAAGGTDRIAAS